MRELDGPKMRAWTIAALLALLPTGTVIADAGHLPSIAGRGAPPLAAAALPRVQQVAVEALSAWLRDRTVRFDVAVDAADADDWTLPHGAEYRARPLPAQLQPARRMQSWVDIHVEGRLARSVLVTATVQAVAPAWVANADLPANSRLRLHDLTRTVVDAAAGGAWPSSDRPVGERLRTPLLKGRYLRPEHLRPLAAVTRGERVELVSRIGDVEIKADARALQDGRVGDRVAVRIPLARGPVHAEVTAPGRTEIAR